MGTRGALASVRQNGLRRPKPAGYWTVKARSCHTSVHTSRNSHSAGARMQAKAAAASARQNWSRRPEAGQPLAAKARPCHTRNDRDMQGLCRPCVSIQGTEGLQWCPQPICRLTREQLQLPCNCMAGGGWAFGWGLIFPLYL